MALLLCRDERRVGSQARAKGIVERGHCITRTITPSSLYENSLKTLTANVKFLKISCFNSKITATNYIKETYRICPYWW